MAGTRWIEAARVLGTGVPPIQAFQNLANGTYLRGALVLVDANGFLIECSANPTVVAGVALSGAQQAAGYQAGNSPTVITGQADVTSVAMFNSSTTFSMRGVNGATDPVTPTLTMLNEQYGALKDANGIWTLDLSNTTQKVFTVIDFDDVAMVFFCKPITSVSQF